MTVLRVIWVIVDVNEPSRRDKGLRSYRGGRVGVWLLRRLGRIMESDRPSLMRRRQFRDNVLLLRHRVFFLLKKISLSIKERVRTQAPGKSKKKIFLF